jgi:hypothetical protein
MSTSPLFTLVVCCYVLFGTIIFLFAWFDRTKMPRPFPPTTTTLCVEPPLAPPPPSAPATTIRMYHKADIFELEDDHDFTVKCVDKEFLVHRRIVCRESAYFRALCEGGFQVRFDNGDTRESALNLCQESHEATADLSEHDTEAVQRTLEFLYGHDYLREPQENDQTSSTSPLDIVYNGTINPHRLNERSSDAWTRDGTARIMEFHAAVYVFADYISNLSLTKIAAEHALSCIDPEDPTKVADAIDFALEITGSNDTKLRKGIVRQCSSSRGIIDQVERCQQLKNTLTRHEPVAWRIAKM